MIEWNVRNVHCYEFVNLNHSLRLDCEYDRGIMAWHERIEKNA